MHATLQFMGEVDKFIVSGVIKFLHNAAVYQKQLNRVFHGVIPQVGLKESIFESLRYSSTAYLAAFAGTKLHCLATEVTGFARLHEIFLRSAAVAAIENWTSMQTKIRRPAATLLANDIFKRSYLRENKSIWLHIPASEMTYTVSSGTLNPSTPLA